MDAGRLEELNAIFDPTSVLMWAARVFAGRIVMATSLGVEDQVLTDMIASAGLDIPVFTIDTGRLFPETYDLIARTEARYGIPIRTYFPDSGEVERLVSSGGINLFRDSIPARKECCSVRKLQPLGRALQGRVAWVTGLRSAQSEARADTRVAATDDATGLVKVSPLAGWSSDQVWEYAGKNDVPVSPLHEQGFPSIGCAPCTRAVAPGEDPRSGRWWWEIGEQRECGLHAHRATASPPDDIADDQTIGGE